MITNMTPTDIYLLSLQSEASRTVMSSRLNIVAKLLQGKSSHRELDWSSISYQTVLGLISKMKAEGKSPSTVNNYLAAVKGGAKEAWRTKDLNVEDYQHIKEVKRIRGKRSEKGRSLSVEELHKLVDFDDTDYITIRDSAIIALSYGAGLRRSETANLELSDINLVEGSVRIMGKGNKEEVNTLSDKILSILQCWLDVRGNKSGKLFLRVNKGNKITEGGISAQAIYNIVKQRQVAAGIDDISTHDLRRSFVTNLLDSGEDVFTVQKLARHADVATTQVYDRRNRSVQDAAAKRLAF